VAAPGYQQRAANQSDLNSHSLSKSAPPQSSSCRARQFIHPLRLSCILVFAANSLFMDP
jgi:hypothetical protein